MEKRSYRGFTAEEKRTILEETRQPGVTLSEVCRKHSVSPALVYQWRAVAQQATTAALRQVDSRGKSQPDAQTARLLAELERMRRVVAEITAERRPGVTLLLLHEEYKQSHHNELSYSQFCEQYRRFRSSRPLLQRQEYVAGDKMLVDYSGKRPHYIDPATDQRDYQELAEHYGAAILPARPYRPRDNAKVEVAVQIAQRWILERLRNVRCLSLAELNGHIRRPIWNSS